MSPGALTYVFRNFPLEIHPLAVKAASAAECAGDQGRFWDMHDRLFAADARLDERSLLLNARAIGLSEPTFRRCLAGSKREKIQADLDEGARLGVRATPTFFLGSVQPSGQVRIVRRIEGAQPFAVFQAAIERMRSETSASGNSRKS